MHTKKFILQNNEPGAAGGTGVVDRGDTYTGSAPEPEPRPAAKTAPADPAVAELDAELEAKAEAEAEAKPDDKDKPKDSRIPLSRHEAVLAKEREKRADLERQLAQYQQGGQVADFNTEITAAENAVMEMERQYATLLADGDVEKAAAVMAKIRSTERSMAEAKGDMKIHAAEIRATERARYGTALERIETAFPTLNPDHADFNQETTDEVLELKGAFEMRGLTPTQALQKAVKLLVEPRTTRQEIATSATPRVSEKDIAAERKAAAVTKAAGAVASTPASLSKAGLDSDKLGGGALDAAAAIKLSQAAFAKLAEEDLSKMRGDTL